MSWKDKGFYNKKMEADTCEMRRLCSEYNRLLPYGSISAQRTAVSVEQCKVADFPWAGEQRSGDLSWSLKTVDNRPEHQDRL